jgi:Uma2 family endonuclease
MLTALTARMRRSGNALTIEPMATTSALRYVRPVLPLKFPSTDPGWEMSESLRHGRLCELVYQILRLALGDACSVGKDNFVYFDASSPRRKCAPDAFVKLGVPQELFDSWKVWEKGAPELAVEILSPSDTEEKLTWEEKMKRYRAIGVNELVCFNVDARRGRRLRAWDRVENDLVERVIVGETTPCVTLGLHWVVAPGEVIAGEKLPATLRLARDAKGKSLLPSEREEGEARAARAEARAAGADARAAGAEARAARAEAELEALRRAAGQKPAKRAKKKRAPL